MSHDLVARHATTSSLLHRTEDHASMKDAPRKPIIVSDASFPASVISPMFRHFIFQAQSPEYKLVHDVEERVALGFHLMHSLFISVVPVLIN